MRIFNPNRIRERRQKKGLSQEELANSANLTREHLIEIEKGRSIPKADTIAKIAKALGVRECYFFANNGR